MSVLNLFSYASIKKISKCSQHLLYPNAYNTYINGAKSGWGRRALCQMTFHGKTLDNRNLKMYPGNIYTSKCFNQTFRMNDIKQFILPNDQPVVELECDTAFNGLSIDQKKYAHYLSQASWHGGLIVLFQTSPEAPLIYALLHKLFSAQSVEDLRALALEKGLTEEEFTALLVYTSGILTNSGNYKGFGDTKFIPNLPSSKLQQVVLSSEAYDKEPQVVQSLWNRCKDLMYSLNDNVKQLGFSEKGVTTYFTKNCTEDDAKIVNTFLKKKNLEATNNRVFKTMRNGSPVFEIRMASSETGDDPGITLSEEEFEGCQFYVTRGDYSSLLRNVTQNLDKAKEFALNKCEKSMLDHYMKSFTRGTLNDHKDGSRYWIKNKGPVVETYIGFIETYRDPAGMRGEFEGFVAMVNKPMSAKFTTLVQEAEVFLPLLPWSCHFEKDTFLQPDFTSLDVLCFASSGIPAGINIPNYDEIRQKEGFKNVSLGNVIPASYKETVTPFLKKGDSDILEKYRIQSFEIQVGLHELLGHGSGKLLRLEENGNYNFDVETLVNPVTGEKIKTWYGVGDTYDSKFTTMGSTYEECRAECVGLYLSLNKHVAKIFGLEGQEADDVIYANWLSMVHIGAGKVLENYQPATKSWLQAHSQARYVIMRVLLEAGEGLLTVTESDPGKDLLIELDRSKIHTVGKKAIGDFLLKLQVYKSTCDVKAARTMYMDYSEVPQDGPHPWAKWREIVLAHKTPRKMFVQSNTFCTGKDVILKRYPATHEGMIQSWVERFPSTDIDNVLEDLWQKDHKHF